MLRIKNEKSKLPHPHMRARAHIWYCVAFLFINLHASCHNKVYKSLSDVTEGKERRLICPLIRFVFLFLLIQVEF